MACPITQGGHKQTKRHANEAQNITHAKSSGGNECVHAHPHGLPSTVPATLRIFFS